MKKHEYEAVIQQGHRAMVVRYESRHRRGSRNNRVDMYNAFAKTYGSVWKPDTVIHELKTIH
jgi:hypothetical protein